MTEDATTFLAFRLIDGEWQAMFLHPDGSGSVKHDVPIAEPDRIDPGARYDREE